VRSKLRRLWTEHVLWTRLVIISIFGGLADFKPTLDRLLKNQDQIGAAIVQTHGMEAGKKFAGLLRAHIKIAGEILVSMRDKKNADDAFKRWDANADEIARFLSTLSPSLPENQMRDMMREHLRLTKCEAVARAQGDYVNDIGCFDKAHAQALAMADLMAAAFSERES
jgi:hypothetical protein